MTARDEHAPRPWPDLRLDRLIDAAVEGDLPVDDATELARRLAADPDARRRYVDWMLLDHSIDEELSAAGVADMVDMLGGQRPTSMVPGRWWRLAAIIALGIVLAAGTLGGGIVTLEAVRASVGLSRREPLAEVSRARLAVPATKGGKQAAPIRKGRLIGAERIAIASGAIELTLASGSMIVLEGPGEVELVSPNESVLHQGAIVVRCAEGVVVSVDTPTAWISCSGGEFAAKVDQSLSTDVQVYEGDVVARGVAKTGSGQFPERIAPRQGRRFSARPDSSPETMGFSPERFTRRVPDGTGIGMEGEPENKKTGRPRLESLVVARASDPPTIDGDLSDWKEAAWFRGQLSAAEWVEGAMMHDADQLYVAAKVGDPLPMRNSVDPQFDAPLVWQGGGLQIFLSGDRATGWPADANGPSYYVNRKIEAPFAERLKAENPRLVTFVMTHHAATNTDRLCLGRAPGFTAAELPTSSFSGRFLRHPDGRGYTLEYAIPWTTLGFADDPPQSGDTLATAWELHLSDETGRLWRNQIIEIRNQKEPPGIFLFERAATWGRANFR
jgi:hypothetical protein